MPATSLSKDVLICRRRVGLQWAKPESLRQFWWDVVGYSRLAGADEHRILARLRTLRSDLIDPAIAVYHGRIVKRTGNGGSLRWRMNT
jgi:class 3 adenylate cyclase